MPRSFDPAKYPPEFFTMLEQAQAGPVIIPHDAPAGLRGYIQAFLRACETAPLLAERAKGTQATSHAGDLAATDPRQHGPHVIVQRRSNSVYAKAVASAIGGGVDDKAAQAAADFLKRMGAAS